MYTRLPKYVPLFLVSALLVTACSDNGNPTGPTASSHLNERSATVEPSVVAPEFLLSPVCFRFRPFGTRFGIVFSPRGDIIITSINFVFLDRFGTRVLPSAFLLNTSAPGTSFSGPLPVPNLRSPTVPIPTSPSVSTSTTSPITIPSPSRFGPFTIRGGTSQTLPFLLQFDCGIPADGTILIGVQTSNGNGSAETSELRVRVRE